MYISDLLKKFKSITAPDIVFRKELIKIIKKITGIKLSKDEVLVKKGVVYIKTKAVYKTEIFIHKESILKSAKDIFGNTCMVKDIR